MHAAAEAAIRSVIHEVAAGRAGADDVADAVEMVAMFHPEVLEEAAMDSIVAAFTEADSVAGLAAPIGI